MGECIFVLLRRMLDFAEALQGEDLFLDTLAVSLVDVLVENGAEKLPRLARACQSPKPLAKSASGGFLLLASTRATSASKSSFVTDESSLESLIYISIFDLRLRFPAVCKTSSSCGIIKMYERKNLSCMKWM